MVFVLTSAFEVEAFLACCDSRRAVIDDARSQSLKRNTNLELHPMYLDARGARFSTVTIPLPHPLLRVVRGNVAHREKGNEAAHHAHHSWRR